MTIRFYLINEPHGYLSNFSRHPIEVHGKVWPTSEHCFQAQKFAGTPWEEAVRLADTPKEAARIGRDRGLTIRPDWEEVKDDVMREAVLAKFTQHPALRASLLATGNEELIEASGGDYYWGEGEDGSGKNMLGKILMEVRASLHAGGAVP